VQSGLIEELDETLELLKIHRPYHESDHVLNIAYNVLCGGRTLEKSSFCARTKHTSMRWASRPFQARMKVWEGQEPEFFEKTARIEADGSIVETTGECNGGMGLSHKGKWGYHPLLILLANTKEPLFICNRSGNRPFYEGTAGYLYRAIEH
jgi:uncharacterized membrane protein